MEQLQAEKMKDQEKRDLMRRREVEADSVVQSLDAELHQLIQVSHTQLALAYKHY